MKANSLEGLVTNSNIAGELRNYTDWHTRLVKFAQLVADWQKEQDNAISRQAEATRIKTQQMCYEKGQADMKQQMFKDAVEAYIVKSYNPCTENSERSLHGIELLYEDKNKPYLLAGDKVRIIVIKAEGGIKDD